MPSNSMNINVYVACFHSQPGQDLKGATGQFEIVEKNIQSGEWPYDNGDDPSFYQARRGNPLTWGVCRQNVRNAIQEHDIVVFLSYTKVNGRVVYRLCSVATVESKRRHTDAVGDSRFIDNGHTNLLIQADPDKERWIHAENDRRPAARHKDWLWRIADHSEVDQETFNREMVAVYTRGWFSNATNLCGNPLRIARNYVMFSDAYLADDPPEVGYAFNGSCETWTNEDLRQAIFGAAPIGTRMNIRTANPSHIPTFVGQWSPRKRASGVRI